MVDDKKRLLDVKARLKKRQPAFIRQDTHKKRRLPKNWRAPKGLHSKIGDNKRGYRKNIKGGYQTPLAVRGLTKQGLLPIVVSNASQIQELDAKTHVLVLSGKVGGRRKIELIEIGLAAGFTFQNASKERADKIKESFEKQSKESRSKEAEREKRQKMLEKEAEKKEKEEKEGPEKGDADETEESATQEERKEQSETPRKATPAKKAPAKKAAKKAPENK